jgi:hypothetical protein
MAKAKKTYFWIVTRYGEIIPMTKATSFGGVTYVHNHPASFDTTLSEQDLPDDWFDLSEEGPETVLKNWGRCYNSEKEAKSAADAIRWLRGLIRASF